MSRSQQALQFIRFTNQGNKLLYGYFSFLNERLTPALAIIMPRRYSNCSCDLFDACGEPVPIGEFQHGAHNYTVLFRVDNFFSGCSPLETLLQSTLECFYNQTCVDRVYTQLSLGINEFENVPPNITILNTTNQWPNETTETIEFILSRLTVNQWLLNISFASYYNACRPSSCTYEFQGQRQFFVIAVIVLSVLGGLSTGLKILTLIFVRLTEKLFRNNSHFHFKQLLKNLFTCQTQPEIIKKIHFVILVILLLLFYLFSYIPSELITLETPKPSLSTYRDLSTRFSQSLQCSCTKNSFNYGTFLSIQPRYHPICSSHFMSNAWILYVYEKQNSFLEYNYTDFRRTSIGQYQSLLSLCELSLRTVDDSVSQLETTDYIGSQLLSLDELNERMEIVTNDFKVNIPRSFLTTFDIIRQVIHSNKLMSMYSSNWRYRDIDMINVMPNISVLPLVYRECNCALSSKCIMQSSGNTMTGCYPLEALLQSTLQCFYEQQCIDSDGIFEALNSSFVSSYFHLNLTIETIVQELMVENYSIDVFYDRYFNACTPLVCTYSYVGRESKIDVIITLIGLYGGLLIISEWLAISIVKLHLCRKRNIAPQIE